MDHRSRYSCDKWTGNVRGGDLVSGDNHKKVPHTGDPMSSALPVALFGFTFCILILSPCSL